MNDISNTTYKLNRLFNIFAPYEYTPLLLGNILFVAVSISSLFYKKAPLPAVISTFVAANIIFIIKLLLNNPRKIQIDGNSMAFNDFIRIRSMYSKHGRSIKVSYSVSDINELEFHQNAVEKMFDVGHITFKGTATFTSKQRYMDRIPDKNSFSIYGIRDFALFKSEYNR
jgi:hypothetical protein